VRRQQGFFVTEQVFALAVMVRAKRLRNRVNPVMVMDVFTRRKTFR
ncbi:hypothetical protein AAUPMB_07862, partial [Pasteurella multocida subsp. multocida str. Anand1_buffalo]